MATLHQYVNQVRGFIHGKNGDNLACLLTYQDTNHSQSKWVLGNFHEDQLTAIKSPWDELVLSHLNVCFYIDEKDFTKAFQEHVNVLQVFQRILQGLKDENWPLPVLSVICRDLRLLARAADEQTTRIRVSKAKETGTRVGLNKDENLEKAAEALMGVFRICATDVRSAPENSKKRGMITIVNQLFKIYYRINKLHLCKPLVRALDNADMMELFPIPEKVTYSYFLGMRSMYESSYKKAELELTYAFLHCSRNSSKNKRLILIFLIPVKMILGHMPKETILEKYNLQVFSPLIQSVKEGNIRAFDESLKSGSEFFWKFGVFLILEKLRSILYRNIFKKIYLILNSIRIPMEAFKVVLEKLQGKGMTMEEVHCIVANLIYDNRIRGYISLPHQKLVVSKQNPFPPLSA